MNKCLQIHMSMLKYKQLKENSKFVTIIFGGKSNMNRKLSIRVIAYMLAILVVFGAGLASASEITSAAVISEANAGESNTTGTIEESSKKTTSSKKSSSTKKTGKRAKVVAYAKKFKGNPYRYGGSSLTHGTDCSGFVMSVYKHFGYKLPHSSSAIARKGRKVSYSSKKPGDIICYYGHVAIYIGGNKIIHASNRKTGICIRSNPKYRKIRCVRRLI